MRRRDSHASVHFLRRRKFSGPEDPTRSSLGHDSHFLLRTLRFEAPHMEIAMRLYHHSELLGRLVREMMRAHPRRDRAAIPLGGEKHPPHVIVARDGTFVTCLRPEMSLAEVPVLPYAPLRVAMDLADGEKHARHKAGDRDRKPGPLPPEVLVEALGKGPGYVTRDMAEIVEQDPDPYVIPLCRTFMTQAALQLKFYLALRRHRHRPHSPLLAEQFEAQSRKLEGSFHLCLYLLGALSDTLTSDILQHFLLTDTGYTEEYALSLARHAEGGLRLRGSGEDRSLPRRSRKVALFALCTHVLHHPGHLHLLRGLPGRLPRSMEPLAERLRTVRPDEVAAVLQNFRGGLPALPQKPSSPCFLHTADELLHHSLHGLPVSVLFPDRALSVQVRASWQRWLSGEDPDAGPRHRPRKPILHLDTIGSTWT